MTKKLTIAFLGTNYHGFERQKNAVGVQNIIEDTLFKILGERISVDGCSRTDKGVHAREFVLSFKTENQIADNRIITGMNHFLPSDIAVKNAETVPDDFHARYSCIGKEYEYLIYNSRNRNPFYENLALLYGVKIDEKILQSAAKPLIGEHDFHSFCGQNGIRENTVRTIHDIKIKRANDNDIVSITVSGDGFLYNMIRIIVGTLLEVNEGKRDPDCMSDILAAHDRRAAGRTVPAEGLYLNRVFYD
jgi:tRNA pseudouridine38-40 synthase